MVDLPEGIRYSESLSKFIRMNYPELIKKNACYCNVYNMLLDVREFKGRDLQVLFCYVPVQECYFRHAFLLCDNEIIEPLLLPWCTGCEVEIDRLVPIRCLKRREYMEMVLLSRGDAGLHEILLKQEVMAYKNSEIELNILEMSYLAERLSDTPEECIRKLKRLAFNDKSVLDENYSGKGIIKVTWSI